MNTRNDIGDGEAVAAFAGVVSETDFGSTAAASSAEASTLKHLKKRIQKYGKIVIPPQCLRPYSSVNELPRLCRFHHYHSAADDGAIVEGAAPTAVAVVLTASLVSLVEINH